MGVGIAGDNVAGVVGYLLRVLGPRGRIGRGVA